MIYLLEKFKFQFVIYTFFLLNENFGLKSDKKDPNRKLPDEQILINNILHDYDPAARPVFNSSKSVVVKFNIALIQIIDMVFNLLFYFLKFQNFIYFNSYFILNKRMKKIKF